MSYPADARKVRNAELPYPRRLAAFHSCVQRYKPLGFTATLSFLRKLAGEYRKDETALLIAIDTLTVSREQWKQAVAEYAAQRRAAKTRGQRTPRPYDPNPSHTPPHWYGAARPGALHALACHRNEVNLPQAEDDVATDVHTLTIRTIATAGHLTTEERELLADLTIELRRRIRARTGAARAQAHRLQQTVRFITTASS